MAPNEVVDDVDVSMDDQDDAHMENRLINEEYKTWKKNSPFLYDMILSTALEWPTLTTQWFPDVKDVNDKNCTVHRLLIGTHTAEGKPNYLQIAELELPKFSDPNPRDYDEERGEIGGYGGKGSLGEPAVIKFNITQKIDHPGEVNKARYQPQNPDIIATLAVDGKVLIFDRTKHSLTPTGTPNPQIELIGHKEEGFGLSWNPHEAGCLATGSEDKTVLLWNLNTVQGNGKTLKPSRKYTHHNHIVNDVQYHPMVKHWIGTVSDDLTLQIIDVRRPDTTKAAVVARDGHSDAINALSFNPRTEFLIATASADKTIGIWDMRNLKQKIHTLEGHVDAVTSLSWHPTEISILGSGGYDRRVLFWDLSRAGEEQLPEDQEDGPPELLFMHGGHTNHLADFSWNLNDRWLVCSAAEDNLLQIWKVADSIVNQDDIEMPMNEMDASNWKGDGKNPGSRRTAGQGGNSRPAELSKPAGLLSPESCPRSKGSDSGSEFEATVETSRRQQQQQTYVTTRRAWAKQIAFDKERNEAKAKAKAKTRKQRKKEREREREQQQANVTTRAAWARMIGLVDEEEALAKDEEIERRVKARWWR